MSKQPPDDEDVILQALLEQVQNAFSDNELEEDGVQQDLMVGVCDSLRALMGISDSFEPKVTLVDGGRDKSDPPTEGEKPLLRVASPDDEGEVEAEEENDSSLEKDDWQSPKVKVRVLRPEDLFTAKKDVVKPKAGRILLDKKGDSQWILQGKRAFVYRIYCQTGHFTILFDQNSSDIYKGQSIDVEGNSIQVVCHEHSNGEFYFIH